MTVNLTDLVETAGSTVGLVIACSIFLQVLTSKSGAIFDRYRLLTGEFRQTDLSEARRDSLRRQIYLYRARCRRIQVATTLVTLAEFAFISAIICSSLGIAWSQIAVIPWLGAISMVAGLVGIAAGAGFELAENILLAHAIEMEVEDLKDLKITRAVPWNASSAKRKASSATSS